MNQSSFEHNSNYSGFDQPPQYSIDHQEDLNQQRISDVHIRWDKIEESLLNMMQSFCEVVIQQKQAANIDQSPPQEMSIQEMEDLKQQYLDEMLSLSNQIQIKDYRNEKIDIRYRRECEFMIDELKGKFNGMSIEINKKKELQQLEQAANLSTYTTEPSRHFNYFYDDDDYEESTIPLNEIVSQIPPSIAITPVLPTLEPEDSLIMGNEELSTIPKKELDEVIKSSVEDLILIPSESKDTFESDMLENIESKDSYVSNHDESALLVTPLFDANEDECFDLGGKIDEIDAFLDIDVSTDIENGYHDWKGDIIYLESFLINDTIPNLPPEVHIEVLSVLWGNRLPIPDSSLSLSSCLKGGAFKKVEEITEVEIRLLALVGTDDIAKNDHKDKTIKNRAKNNHGDRLSAQEAGKFSSKIVQLS
ncbi:hypothetical protein Tco_0707955 [Tanacetum coccineum]